MINNGGSLVRTGRIWLTACLLAVSLIAPAQNVAEEEQGLNEAPPANTPIRNPIFRARALQLLGSTGLLLIPESTNDRVMAFDPMTGNLVDPDFIPADPTNLSTPICAILGFDPDTILVSDQLDDVVQAYDMAGNYLGVFAPAGGGNTAILDNIRGIAISSNNTLLVTVGGGANDDAVAEFDSNGNYLGNLVANGAGGLNSPFDVLLRNAESDYLVGGITSDAIHRYDLAGGSIGDLTPINTFPEQIALAANGNILVANFSGTEQGVVEYTPGGALVGIYDPASLGGYRGVYELPNGNILTTNGGGVHEIDRNGNLVDTKIASVSARFIELLGPSIVCENVSVSSRCRRSDRRHRESRLPFRSLQYQLLRRSQRLDSHSGRCRNRRHRRYRHTRRRGSAGHLLCSDHHRLDRPAQPPGANGPHAEFLCVDRLCLCPADGRRSDHKTKTHELKNHDLNEVGAGYAPLFRFGSQAEPTLSHSREKRTMNTLKPTREAMIDDQAVKVFDGLTAPAEMMVLEEMLRASPFSRTEFAKQETMQYKHWVREFGLDQIESLGVFQAAKHIVETHFGGGPFRCFRAYCNAAFYGDMLMTHRDCNPREKNVVTALWYICKKWDIEWGGETLFIDQAQETVFAANPKPGRLVIFEGSILHVGRPPNKICVEPRYTLAFKFLRESSVSAKH